ncbi:hypothetical protein PMAYCL1PPCAC_25444, partial [Pristionchus mayeri]
IVTIKEWKKKIREFSNKSNDEMVTVISRMFDVMSLILKNSEPGRIKRALTSLDFERVNCLKLEKSNELSIRSLMF